MGANVSQEILRAQTFIYRKRDKLLTACEQAVWLKVRNTRQEGFSFINHRRGIIIPQAWDMKMVRKKVCLLQGG